MKRKRRKNLLIHNKLHLWSEESHAIQDSYVQEQFFLNMWAEIFDSAHLISPFFLQGSLNDVILLPLFAYFTETSAAHAMKCDLCITVPRHILACRRENFWIEFLINVEKVWNGLNHDILGEWVDWMRTYRQEVGMSHILWF